MILSTVKLWVSSIGIRSSARPNHYCLADNSSNRPHTLLTEPAFLRAICLERKRSQRSRRLFVLFLVDLDLPLHGGTNDSLLTATVCLMLSAFRETDIVGWYKEGSTLGVIFVDLGTANKQSILTALSAKVTTVLESSLRTEELSR